MRENRDYLNSLHPVCPLIYFVLMTGVSMMNLYPAYLVCAFVSSFGYAVYLKGFRKQLKVLYFAVPAAVAAIIINSLFNHRGVTTLFYLPDGNPFTLESVYYGLNFSLMLVSVITQFSCFNVIATSDKTVCLLGGIMPSLSLFISMVLRFVPKLSSHINDVNRYRNSSFSNEKNNLKTKISSALSVFSSTVSWAFESSVTTSDSMRSRGSSGRRSAMSIYKFAKREVVFTLFLIVFGAVSLIPVFTKNTQVNYYPEAYISPFNAINITGTACFFIFCMLPMIFNLTEEIKWRISLSRI